MLSYGGLNTVYLSPAAATPTNCSSLNTIFIGPPTNAIPTGAEDELQLSITVVPSPDAADMADAALSSGASGWGLRPVSRIDTTVSPLLVTDGIDTSAAKVNASTLEFPAELRTERILEYDASRYPFREMLAKILHSDPASNSAKAAYGDTTESIHEEKDVPPSLYSKSERGALTHC